jgi:hypothetical protein
MATYCTKNDAGLCGVCGIPYPDEKYARECHPMSFLLDQHSRNVSGDRLPPAPLEAPPTDGPGTEQMPTRSAPGFLDKLRNFATAAAGHVAAGMPMASDEEIVRRHDICLGCEHLVDNACTQCGCPVARVRGYVSKLSWADSECPVGKWGRATPDS